MEVLLWTVPPQLLDNPGQTPVQIIHHGLHQPHLSLLHAA